MGQRQLVKRSLDLLKEIAIEEVQTRYLAQPDVTRLKTNIRRMSHLKSDASETIRRLLTIEYRNLKNVARSSGLYKALSRAEREVNESSSVLIISQLNHDAEAVSFIQSSLMA